MASLIVTGVVGFLARGSADEYKSHVDAHASLLSSQQQQKEDAERESKVQRSQVTALKQEFAVGEFVGRVLEGLEQLPPEISLDKLDTNRVVQDGKVFLELRLAGRADHSDRQGIAHLTALKTLMNAVPGVRRVDLPPPTERNGVYEFTLIVSPDAEPPPEKRSGRPKFRGGRGGRG